MIRILDLVATQPELDRMYRFDEVEDDVLPPVFIALCPDGVYEIRDGHHRLAYYRMRGKDFLDEDEYYVIRVEGWMERFGSIDDVMQACGLLEISQ